VSSSLFVKRIKPTFNQNQCNHCQNTFFSEALKPSDESQKMYQDWKESHSSSAEVIWGTPLWDVA